MNDVVIKRMAEEQIGQVAEIEAAVFSSPWTKEGFASALQREEALFYTAAIEDVVAGYCGIYLAADEGEITNVAVAERFRRRGIADLLVGRILKASEERGAVRIFLEVRASNVQAIQLYQKHGFQAVGTRKAFYQKPTEDALLMCWQSKKHLPNP